MFKIHYPNFFQLKFKGEKILDLDIPEREQSRKRVDKPFELIPFINRKDLDRSYELTVRKLPNKYDSKQERLDDSSQAYIFAVYFCFKIPLTSYEITNFFSEY